MKVTAPYNLMRATNCVDLVCCIYFLLGVILMIETIVVISLTEKFAEEDPEYYDDENV